MASFHAARRRVLVAASHAAPESVRAVQRFARENDWHMVTDAMFGGVLPPQWNGDGVIALGPAPLGLLKQIQRFQLPCTALTDGASASPFPCIGVNDTEVGRLAADHFLARSHRNFTFAPFANDIANLKRFDAFRARVEEQGCKCQALKAAITHADLCWEDNWIEHREEFFDELRRLPRPNAIFAFNDWTAAHVIEACHEIGFSVPQEIAVLGAGNTILCETSPVPISTIEWDLESSAYQAAALLHELMENKHSTHRENICISPIGVITRVSSDFTAVADQRVARALTYIAENYTDPLLSVGDVATAVGASRRHLERCFRIHTGYTLHEQINRSRMQEASRLLKTHPRVRTAEVATLVGVLGAGTFSRTFRRHFGVSPQEHRAWATQIETVNSVKNSVGAARPSEVAAQTSDSSAA